MGKISASLIVCLLLFGCNKNQEGSGVVPGTKREKIVSLLELTGALKMGKQISTAMLNQVFMIWEKGGIRVDPTTIELFKSRFSEEVDKDWVLNGPLMGQIVEIYSRHFSEEEIDEMEKFYRTETGKKTIQVMPVLISESMAVGQKWGEERGAAIAKEILGEMKEQGYEIPNI